MGSTNKSAKIDKPVSPRFRMEIGGFRAECQRHLPRSHAFVAPNRHETALKIIVGQKR